MFPHFIFFRCPLILSLFSSRSITKTGKNVRTALYKLLKVAVLIVSNGHLNSKDLHAQICVTFVLTLFSKYQGKRGKVITFW